MPDSEIIFEVLKMHFNTIKESKLELKRIRKGDNVVLVTFGAGLVSAANVVRF